MIDGGVYVKNRGTDFRDRFIEFLLKKLPCRNYSRIVFGKSLKIIIRFR
jgi:hypothetical protein